MRANEINNGDSFSCRIQGRSVTGRVNTQFDNTRVLLCNNIKLAGGVRPPELFGKSGCWVVRVIRGVLDFPSSNVTEFRITKRAAPKAKVATAKRAAAKIATSTSRGTTNEELLRAATKETPSQKIERLRREIQQAEEEERNSSPGRFRSWNITRSGNSFTFGCGEVQLTKDELAAWLKVQRHLNRRGGLSINGDGSRVSNLTAINKQHIVDTINHGLEVAERIVNLR